MLNVEIKQRDFSTPWPSVFEYVDFECFVLCGVSLYRAESLYPLTRFAGESDSIVDDFMAKDAYYYYSDLFNRYS